MMPASPAPHEVLGAVIVARMTRPNGAEALVDIRTLPFTQWLAAIGIPAKHDPDYHIALSAASGLDVPRVPAPPLGGGQANRAARREWRALIRVWERANAKALAKLRVRWEGQRK